MQNIIAFVLEIDKLKSVTRKTRPLGLQRQENSAEHSWQLALFASALAKYAASAINVERVVMMLLVHDLGEIATGDTLVYIEDGLAERKVAEQRYITDLFAQLPQDTGDVFTGVWHEFEEGETPESQFAHAIDRAMPVLLNLANEGQSWRENGITYERVVARIAPPIKKGCPALWEYLSNQLLKAKEKGYFCEDLLK